MYTNQTATHFILRVSGTTEEYVGLTTFKVNIQPATGEAIALINGVYGQTFSAYTTYSGLMINDVVTISGTTSTSGYTYRVKAREDFNYGPLPHYEYIFTREA